MSTGFLPSLAAFITTASIAYLTIAAAAAVTGALYRGGRRARPIDAHDALAVSRLTIPVSVIVTVDDDADRLSTSIAALLDLNYPELEVIVVIESTSEAAIQALTRDWSLRAKEILFRRILPTAPVRRILCSDRDARLIVVLSAGSAARSRSFSETAKGGRADALNCGVNMARFRYVVSVTPNVVFDANALLRLMAPALRDPDRVLAVTSYVERRAAAAATGLRSRAVPELRNTGWTKAGEDYQQLASIRAWMVGRLAGHDFRHGPHPLDGVTACRRDAVLELGGFSLTAAEPELDLLVRLQTSRMASAAYSIVRTLDVFGYIDTDTVAHVAWRSRRRRRALFEAIGSFQGTQGTHRARLAMMSVPAAELLACAAQATAVSVTLLAAAVGWVGWPDLALVLVLLTFGYGSVSAAALLLRGGTPGAPSGGDLARLLARAPLEFAVYRPALVLAQLRQSLTPDPQSVDPQCAVHNPQSTASR